MGGAAGAAIPHADGDARSFHSVRAADEVGSGGNGGVGIVGLEINRLVAIKGGDFPDRSVRKFDAQWHPQLAGARPGRLAALLGNHPHALDDVSPRHRIGKIGTGLFKKVRQVVLGGSHGAEGHRQQSDEPLASGGGQHHRIN